MIFIQSLWTGTPKFIFDRNAALVMSASAASICRYTKNTQLVTDKHGLEISDRLGWGHSTIKIGLDDFCHDKEKEVWALGKIRAQEIQPDDKPTAHVDLDFFIDKLPDSVGSATVSVQSLDPLEYYQRDFVVNAISSCGLSRTAPAYNCGFIGFSDTQMRKEYVARAYRAASILSRKGVDGTCASIVAEQALVGTMCEERSIRPLTLAKTPSMIVQEDHDDCVFMHLWGRSKSRGKVLKSVEKMFRERHPDAYGRFLLGVGVLMDKGICKR